MKMTNRRESSNIEDRRRGRKTRAAAGGIGGLSIVGILLYFVLSGGNVSPAVVAQLSGANGGTQPSDNTQAGPVQTTDSAFYKNNADFENEEALRSFIAQVLGSTEDIWTTIFQKAGKKYQMPKMVVFSQETTSGCGKALSNMGPFYCPVDQTVYLDLNFLATMKKQLGADGDFAFAYVIAHEVGHHVQYLTGELAKYQTMEHKLKEAGKKAEANLVSVQIELEADCYAGLWGRYEQAMFKSLESTDFMEAFHAAKSVGDDTLGNTHRDTFSHGSAKMRQAWFKTGFEGSDMSVCNTYQYASLDALENKQ
ncbi:MAG: neutral zinc metallopeptidase [Proteobacteria bacterium]|jgi:predicted metalloprotease|nr:neutral zinc metallopeptidase [Pseudomonadota bacterium]